MKLIVRVGGAVDPLFGVGICYTYVMYESELSQLRNALERAWRWMQAVDLEREPQRYVDEYDEDAEIVRKALDLNFLHPNT